MTSTKLGGALFAIGLGLITGWAVAHYIIWPIICGAIGRLRECVMVADMKGSGKMHWHRTYKFPDLNDAAHVEPPPLTDDTRVTVCDNCLQASCWQGIFMCDEARDAGVVVKTVGELRKLNWENESYWR